MALLDIEMPGIDGLAAAAVLFRELPAGRSLILTTFGRPRNLRRALDAGAHGFIVKDAPPEQLADAIRRVVAGQRVVDPSLAAATVATGPSVPTARERDVLVACKDGTTIAEIALRLYLSESTVRNYLSAAVTKTAARNRIDADIDGDRYQVFITDHTAGDIAFLEALYRGTGRCKCAIRDANDTGLAHFPSQSFAINQVWLAAVLIAGDLWRGPKGCV